MKMFETDLDLEAETEMRQYVSAREFYMQTGDGQARLGRANMLEAMLMAREFEIEWRALKNNAINRKR